MIHTITRNDSRTAAFGLTVLRVVTGIIFLAHGLQKLFTWSITGTTAAFAQMGIPFPDLAAPTVTMLETVGGVALILGAATHIVAPLLTINMIAALFLFHLPAGLFMPDGYELVLILGAATTAITLTGPGAIAVDAVLRERVRTSRTETQQGARA